MIRWLRFKYLYWRLARCGSVAEHQSILAKISRLYARG